MRRPARRRRPRSRRRPARPRRPAPARSRSSGPPTRPSPPAFAAMIFACVPPRHTWQMARASASAASAGRGGAPQPQQPGHHRGHLRLVGLAGAGDGGLDLARACTSAPGSPARAAASTATAPRLRGAHDRADVVLAEHPLDRDRVRPVHSRRSRASASSRASSRWARSSSGRCRPPRPRRAGRSGPARRRRRRRRTGSAPGPLRARAPALPPPDVANTRASRTDVRAR